MLSLCHTLRIRTAVCEISNCISVVFECFLMQLHMQRVTAYI